MVSLLLCTIITWVTSVFVFLSDRTIKPMRRSFFGCNWTVTRLHFAQSSIATVRLQPVATVMQSCAVCLILVFWGDSCCGRFSTRMQHGSILWMHSSTALWLCITFDIVLIVIPWPFTDIRWNVFCGTSHKIRINNSSTWGVFALKHNTRHNRADGLKGVYFSTNYWICSHEH